MCLHKPYASNLDHTHCDCVLISEQEMPPDEYSPVLYSHCTPICLQCSAFNVENKEVEYEDPFVFNNGSKTAYKRSRIKLKVKSGSLQEQALEWQMTCARFVFNKVLELNFKQYAAYEAEVAAKVLAGMSEKEAKKLCSKPKLSQSAFNELLKEVKSNNPWLSQPKAVKGGTVQAYQQVLQQAAYQARDAVINYVSGRAGKPKFRCVNKCKDNRVLFPQHFRIDDDRSAIKIPGIGWFKYFNSDNLKGEYFNKENPNVDFKSITVCREQDGWFVSVLCEYENTPAIETPNPKNAIGIDVGVVKRISMSNGSSVEGLNERLKPLEEKVKKLQADVSRKVKGSRNRREAILKVAKVRRKIANIRADVNNKDSSSIVKQYDVVCVEALRITNMTKSASGTIENPGKNVKAKSGLNRSILNQGWGDFFRMLQYKLLLKGGVLVRVNPRHTSQLCPNCGHISPKNRKSQASFECEKCHYVANADVNAATNILRRGVALLMESFPSVQV